jgi:hypothetical protein
MKIFTFLALFVLAGSILLAIFGLWRYAGYALIAFVVFVAAECETWSRR